MPAVGVIGYESITVSTASIGFTQPWSNSAGMAPNSVSVTVESNPIRFRSDGTAPTSSEGHLVQPGGVIQLNGRKEARDFRAIRSGAADGVLKVTYFSDAGL